MRCTYTCKWNPLTSRALGMAKFRWENDIIKDIKNIKLANWTDRNEELLSKNEKEEEEILVLELLYTPVEVKNKGSHTKINKRIYAHNIYTTLRLGHLKERNNCSCLQTDRALCVTYFIHKILIIFVRSLFIFILLKLAFLYYLFFFFFFLFFLPSVSL